ncbi:MAG: glycosyltransferase [candidate division KSB1 bacterium]|nr:glycosyltransferase [candidate division KSB1 bacterium]
MSEPLTNTEIGVLPFVSVIIPTYNRKESLLRTLDSLARQTYPADRFEVIVVDDGGTDSTDQIVQNTYPFKLLYCRQTNQGSAAARNHGALKGSGDILVFVDDDVLLEPGYVGGIVRKTRSGVVTMGVWLPYRPIQPSIFSQRIAAEVEKRAASRQGDEEVPYTECTSNNLALQRDDFFRVGMWQDVLGDGPTLWGDVEFGYRAWKAGCRFVRVADAGIVHCDQHISDLKTAIRRAHHVSRIVQPLFALHPQIKDDLPMFRDKGPIAWRQDPPRLILRKLARQLASSPPALWAMERSVPLLERHAPNSKLLALFYRWIISGYIYRGYRQGLQDLRRKA